MTQLGQLLQENGVKCLEKAKTKARKASPGSELINNLIYRLQRKGNLVAEMDNHYVKKVRISLSSNFFNTDEKNFHIWAHPYPVKNKQGYWHLMLKIESPKMLAGYRLRASDIFGKGINKISIN